MNLIETVKAIANITKKIGDIELNSKIIDLQSDVLELLEENHRLRQEIANNENEDKIENSLFVKGHFYYRKNNELEDGPFCTACWDNNKKLIRCHISESFGGVKMADCPVCKNASSYID